MSHIPSAAMPHAKPHEHHEKQESTPTIAPAIRREPLPWAGLAAGGVLAVGGAITAALLLRGGKKKSGRRTAGRRSPAKSKPRATKARRTKAADGAAD